MEKRGRGWSAQGCGTANRHTNNQQSDPIVRGWGRGVTGTSEGFKPVYVASASTTLTKPKITAKSKWDNLYDAATIHEKIPYIRYYPNFIPNHKELYQKFLEDFPFELRRVELANGKSYQLNRETCVFADPGIMDVPPKIWGSNNPIQNWTPELFELKTKIEQEFKDILNGQTLTVALANNYPDGTYSIGHHPDREERGSTEFIASGSFGEDRVFEYIDVQTGEVIRLILEGGSLLLMLKGCQEHYTHSLPPDPNCKGARGNITYRIFKKENYIKY